jgi:hypothetical protein
MMRMTAKRKAPASPVPSPLLAQETRKWALHPGGGPGAAGGAVREAAPSRGAGHGFSRLPILAPPGPSASLRAQPTMQSCPLVLAGPRACPFGGACHTCPARFQAKLTTNQPGDAYEQEADRVAERVMRMTEPPASPNDPAGSESPDAVLQRECACGGAPGSAGECEERREERLSLHRSTREAGPGTQRIGEAPEIVHEALRSPGQALDADTRAFMEPRFGHDFSQVRVHADARGSESVRAVHARAYTVGRDVVFGAGQYSPGASEGRRLIAHELAHVVQQGSSPATGRFGIEMGSPSSSQEAEADAISNAIGDPFQTVPLRPRIRTGAPVLNRAVCTPAAKCAVPIAGAAEDFGTAVATVESGPRARRKKMTPARAMSTGHAGRPRQLENFLEKGIPGRKAQIQGIFIDREMSPSVGASTEDCSAWIAESLPPGTMPPGMAGATKPCVFVHPELNQEALAFNTTKDVIIGGVPREDWRIGTLQSLTHEVAHVVFDTSARPTPAGVATPTCTRANIDFELSELAAILSEFLPVFRAVPASAAKTDPAKMRLDNWFSFKITNPSESIQGILEKIGCQCNCAEVKAFVKDTFDASTGSWTAAEKTAFHTELRLPKWGIAWPL